MVDNVTAVAKVCAGGLTVFAGVLASKEPIILFGTLKIKPYQIFCAKAGIFSSVLFIYGGIGIIVNTMYKDNVMSVYNPLKYGVILYILSIV
jgi:hypothetical protein